MDKPIKKKKKQKKKKHGNIPPLTVPSYEIGTEVYNRGTAVGEVCFAGYGPGVVDPKFPEKPASPIRLRKEYNLYAARVYVGISKETGKLVAVKDITELEGNAVAKIAFHEAAQAVANIDDLYGHKGGECQNEDQSINTMESGLWGMATLGVLASTEELNRRRIHCNPNIMLGGTIRDNMNKLPDLIGDVEEESDFLYQFRTSTIINGISGNLEACAVDFSNDTDTIESDDLNSDWRMSVIVARGELRR